MMPSYIIAKAVRKKISVDLPLPGFYFHHEELHLHNAPLHSNRVDIRSPDPDSNILFRVWLDTAIGMLTEYYRNVNTQNI